MDQGKDHVLQDILLVTLFSWFIVDVGIHLVVPSSLNFLKGSQIISSFTQYTTKWTVV